MTSNPPLEPTANILLKKLFFAVAAQRHRVNLRNACASFHVPTDSFLLA